VVVYHGRERSEGGNIVPSCYESFRHTEPSPVVKIEITNTVRAGAIDPIQRILSEGAIDPVPRNAVRAGGIDPVPRNTVGVGAIDPVQRNNVRGGAIDPVPRNAVRAGTIDSVPRNTVSGGNRPSLSKFLEILRVHVQLLNILAFLTPVDVIIVRCGPVSGVLLVIHFVSFIVWEVWTASFHAMTEDRGPGFVSLSMKIKPRYPQFYWGTT